MTALEPLLALQERDLALDRLRHRRETLAERAALAELEARVAQLTQDAEAVRGERDSVLREETRFGDEASALDEQAIAAEKKLYSGEIASPRELQALQADIEQLRKHQRLVEDRQLGAMEQREPLETQLAALDVEITPASTEAERLRAALQEAEGVIDAEASVESSARADLASGIDDGLLGDYEARRAKANGVGAARLVGNTCQGCHLSIPATEVDRIRKAPEGVVAYCDNCGCILVP